MRPLFIGGHVRSGTTMLCDMMGCHPRISPIYETEFVINLLQVVFGARSELPLPLPEAIRRILDRFARGMDTMGTNRQAYERFVHGMAHLAFTPDELRAAGDRLAEAVADPGKDRLLAMRRFVTELFDRHCAADGKPRWVNKTPANLQYAAGLRVLFPDLVLIHIVRDGRDVAASSITREFGPRTLREGATWWAAAIEFGETFGRAHPGQYLEIRYEDLVHDPDVTLLRVFDYVGERLPPDLVARWKSRVGGLHDDRIGRHRDVFTARDHEMFDGLAGAHLARCGYAREAGGSERVLV